MRTETEALVRKKKDARHICLAFLHLKSLAEFARKREKSQNCFSGDMCVGKTP